MNSIGLFTNTTKDNDFLVTKALIEIIHKNNIEVYISQSIAQEINRPELGIQEDVMFSNSDMIIALGGDGTFLGVARKAFPYNTPILGLNLGTLGFLAEINKEEFENAIKHLINGDYKIQERMLLDIQIKSLDGGTNNYYALNEVTVNRGTFSRIINYKTNINDKYLDTFPADGIIVATPTGSTAYSLSAGGPLVDPDLSVILITLICPHILTSRSIVVNEDRKIDIELENYNSDDAVVAVDGQQNYTIKSGDIITVKKAENTLKMVKLSDKTFYDTIREKLLNRCLA